MAGNIHMFLGIKNNVREMKLKHQICLLVQCNAQCLVRWVQFLVSKLRTHPGHLPHRKLPGSLQTRAPSGAPPMLVTSHSTPTSWLSCYPSQPWQVKPLMFPCFLKIAYHAWMLLESLGNQLKTMQPAKEKAFISDQEEALKLDSTSIHLKTTDRLLEAWIHWDWYQRKKVWEMGMHENSRSILRGTCSQTCTLRRPARRSVMVTRLTQTYLKRESNQRRKFPTNKCWYERC